MRYLAAGAAGIVAAIVGWLVTAWATVVIAGLAGVSDFEGARGMLAFLGIGPLGGLAAMVVAVWVVLRSGRRGLGAGATLARVGLVLAGIAGLAGAAVGVRLATLDTYTDELPPQLEVEVRLPPALAVADRSAIRIALHDGRAPLDALLADPWARTEGGQQVVAGTVELARKTSSRLLAVTLPDGSERLFPLRLGRDPGATAAFGDWQRPAHVARAGEEAVRPAAPDDPVALRVRVRRAGDE